MGACCPMVNKTAERRTYVCKRSRMCSYLMECGFSPYRIVPDRDNPKYSVYLFTATPELHSAVMDYVISKQKQIEERRTSYGEPEKRIKRI